MSLQQPPLSSLMRLSMVLLCLGLSGFLGHACSRTTGQNGETSQESGSSKEAGSSQETTTSQEKSTSDETNPADAGPNDGNTPGDSDPQESTLDASTSEPPPEPQEATPDTDKTDQNNTEQPPQETPQDQATIPCKHDCDCVKHSQVCEAEICQPLRRASRCLPCDGGNCTPGEPCLAKDTQFGTCPANTGCKHDCDCFKDGKVCHNNTCLPLERLSMCLSCSSSQCQAGSPCHNADKSIGTCATSCKDDCDCKKVSMNCEKGTCQPTKRLSNCPACSSTNCPQGNSCYNPDNSVGTCGTTPSCNDKSCSANTVCKQSDGTLARCCCSIAGCNTGYKCCPSTGVKPPPGYCGFRCFQGTQCPPPPP